MPVKLNKAAFEHAQERLRQGQVVLDERDAWSEHQPSTKQEHEFIRRHGILEYAKWYLGIDDEQDPQTKAAYEFPYGDFENVHRCAVLSAESRVGQYENIEDIDIIRAAIHLHGMVETIRRQTTKAA
jgi:hypothetical protein